MADVLMCVNCADSSLSGAAQNGQCMTSKYRESDKSAGGSNAFEWLSMSYTDHSVQRRLKSNAPIGMIERKCEKSRHRCGQVKNIHKKNHYFYLNIAKIAPCRIENSIKVAATMRK